MAVSVDVKVDGKVVQTIDLDTRDASNPFRTGSIGYHKNEALSIEGKGYQANLMLIEKGTKGKYSSE